MGNALPKNVLKDTNPACPIWGNQLFEGGMDKQSVWGLLPVHSSIIKERPLPGLKAPFVKNEAHC